MRIQLIEARHEEGAVAVMTALLVVALIGVVAFTTDFGMAYAQRRALSTGADSAALAVAHAKYLSVMKNPTLKCGDLDGNSLGYDSASSQIAWDQVKANKPFNEVIPLGEVITKLSCDGVGILKVTVDVVNHPVSTILGGVLGASNMNVSSHAEAALGVADRLKLEPLALCSAQANDIIDHPGVPTTTNGVDTYPAQNVSLNKNWGTTSLCGTSAGAGNWGWLSLPGQAGGESGLGTMIANGYSGALAWNYSTSPPSVTLGGSPGNKDNGQPVQDALQTIMNKGLPVTFPVYQAGTISNNGQNATYTVTGFLSVELCGYNSGPTNNGNGPANLITAACYDNLRPAAAGDMQVRFVDYVDVATSMGEKCGLGDPTCGFNSFAIKLLK